VFCTLLPVITGTIIFEMLSDGGANMENENKDCYTAFLLPVKLNPWSGGIPQKIRDNAGKKNRGVNFFERIVFSAVENNVGGGVSRFDKYNDCIHVRKYLDHNGFNNTKIIESVLYTPLTKVCQLGH